LRGDLTRTIGNTPLVPLKSFSSETGAEIFAKLEGFNPGGSIKDRIALSMIEAAEREGLLRPGGMIVEPTSGNTGIGLALVAAVKGYALAVTMPESMSIERRRIMTSYGADVVLTPADPGMPAAIKAAQRIAAEGDNVFLPMQFTNKANPGVHREKTGPEIWEDTGGDIDGIICGVGTGGTLTGVGEALKSRKPDIVVIAVEPAESPVLSGGEPGPHVIEGIGAGFVPDVLNRDIIDEIITVTGTEAAETARLIARREGIFCGISSGAAMAAVIRVASRAENRGKRFVVIFPDRGEKYLSTGLWD
jgi:cysteine synthase A